MKAKFYKNLIAILLILGGINLTYAQDLVNITMTVTEVAHNFECCNDGAGSCGGFPTFTTDRPEPRWRISGSYQNNGGGFINSGLAIINPGNGVTCGTLTRSDNVFTLNGVCADEVRIEVDMWEEDGCGSDNTFDDNCFANDDNNRSLRDATAAIPGAGASGSFNLNVTGGGGYTAQVRVDWSRVAQPTISGTTSVCEGQTTTLIASSAQAVGGSNFYWYDAPTGGSLLFTGATYTTPSLTAGTTSYYVSYGPGTCTTERTQIDINATSAPAPTTTGGSGCPGGSAILTASAAGAVGYNWYDDASMTTLLGTGASFATPPLSGTTTYYATADYGACESPVTSVIATESAAPSPPVATGNSYCTVDDVILTASGSGGTLNWYDNAAGTSFVGSGSPLNLGTMAAGAYTYYVAESNGSCESTLTSVAVSVVAAPGLPTANDVDVCPNAVATLSATEGTAANFNWYNSMSATVPIATGSVYTTPTITGPTSYYVSAVNGSGCEGSREQVDISLISSPSPSVTGTTTVCPNETTTLTANAAGASSYNWYTNVDGTGLVGSSAAYTTPMLTSNTTFYATAVYPNGCESLLEPAAVTVGAAPNPPVASNVSVCEGEDVIVNGVALSAGTLNWYDAPSAGSLLGSSASYNAGAMAAGNYTYFVAESNGSCESNRTPVLATVNSLPTAPTVSGTTICSGESATLTATGSSNAHWYADAGLTDLLLVGNSFTTPTLSTNTSYYVTQESSNGCEGSATQVDVVVNPSPADPVGTGTTVCSGSVATLTATNAGGTTNWYSDQAGTNLVGGNMTSFDTPALTQTTTYYVQEESTSGCLSNLVPVMATINVNQVFLVPFDTVCTQANAAFNLTGGLPSGGTYSGNGVSSNVFNGSSAGAGTHLITYTYTDGNGCTGTASENIVVVESNTAASGITATSNVVCNAGSVTLTVSGGNLVAGADWYWYESVCGGTSIGNGTSITVNPTQTTTYLVRAEGGTTYCGPTECVAKTITVANPTVVLTPFDDVCGAAVVTLTNGVPSGGVYSGAGVSGNEFNAATAGAGTHTINYEYTDVNGCVVDANADITVIQSDITVTTATEVESCSDGGIVVHAFASGGDGFYYYTWSDGTTENPHLYTEPGTYAVEVSDGSGCNAAATDIVVTEELACLEIPNTFTPNGDGTNDTWNLDFTAYSSASIQVFSRWGVLVFESSDVDFSWDGVGMSGEQLPAGTYYYVVELDGGSVTQNGPISIVR